MRRPRVGHDRHDRHVHAATIGTSTTSPLIRRSHRTRRRVPSTGRGVFLGRERSLASPACSAGVPERPRRRASRCYPVRSPVMLRHERPRDRRRRPSARTPSTPGPLGRRALRAGRSSAGWSASRPSAAIRTSRCSTGSRTTSTVTASRRPHVRRRADARPTCWRPCRRATATRRTAASCCPGTPTSCPSTASRGIPIRSTVDDPRRSALSVAASPT